MTLEILDEGPRLTDHCVTHSYPDDKRQREPIGVCVAVLTDNQSICVVKRGRTHPGYLLSGFLSFSQKQRKEMIRGRHIGMVPLPGESLCGVSGW